jgi:hypothetical protein
MNFKVNSEAIHIVSICYLGLNLQVKSSKEAPSLKEVLDLCRDQIHSITPMGDCRYVIAMRRDTVVDGANVYVHLKKE